MTDRNLLILKKIYVMRFLSEAQIFKYIYSDKSKNIGIDYCQRQIRQLIKDGYIVKEQCYDKRVPNIYSLTTKGVNFLKNEGSIFDELHIESSEMNKLHTASELKVKEKNITHTYFLNEFVLGLLDVFKENAIYTDERVFKKGATFRTDGIIETDRVIYMIELDMGTENLDQLKDKWARYSHYLTEHATDKAKKIKVLFGLSGVSDYDKRAITVYKSIKGTCFDFLSKDFDILIGSLDEIIDIISDEYSGIDMVKDSSLSLIGSSLKLASNLDIISKKYFEGEHFIALAQGSKNVDLIFASYVDKSLTSIRDCSQFEAIASDYLIKTNRRIKTIIICKTLSEARTLATIFPLNGCYFTTLRRLSTFSIGNSIVSVIDNKRVSNYKDSALFEIYETWDASKRLFFFFYMNISFIRSFLF